MKNIMLLLVFGFMLMSGASVGQEYVLLIHGGAGNITRENITPEEEKQYFDALSHALDIGEEILKNGGASLDAVEAVVIYLEDCPLFNAGKGAVLNEKGRAEMDAAVMNGKNLKAGCVAGVHIIKNPIRAARLVMDSTRHVMLVSEGAESFAKKMGLDLERHSYFITPKREAAHKAMKEKERPGTVGAVALDKSGNLAAATSTGGMAGKMPGRVGDTPIIGAGTYANNMTCAVSATGHGEFFIRNVVAYDISSLVQYSGLPLEEACRIVIREKVGGMGATGGVIAIDKEGNYTIEFNTAGMFRGVVTSKGVEKVLIFE